MDSHVEAWFGSASTSNLYLSVVTVLELEMGCLRIERRDRAQGKVLRSWIQGNVLPAFSGRILTIDIPIAIRCATLHVPNPCSDRDALIAATALVHGLTLVTRNTSDFLSTGVPLLNPWQI
jgi:hypothetical protein